MRILADKAIPFINHFFSSYGELRLVDGRDIDLALLDETDLLVVRTITKVDEKLLRESEVRLVASATSGIDHVDTDYLQQRGIGFVHAPGCNARAVAEYVLSSLFVLADQYGVALADKQVGIIGYGHVGSQLDRFLQACGIQTLINDPPLEQVGGEQQFCSLEQVLQADIVSLHVPYSRQGSYPTHHLLNADTLEAMRGDVIIMNTSRGAVIDSHALLEFKQRNVNAHLVLDVWENEPDIDLSLLQATNLNTSHIAGYSTDAKLRGTQMVYEQAHRYFDEKPAQEVPAPVLPDSEVSEIRLAQQDDDVDALQLAVLAAYDVRSDSASLRRILEISQDERAAFFNELRNNYPLRREFSALNVRLLEPSQRLQTSLQNLGFTVNCV